MCVIDVHLCIQCSDTFSEVLVNDDLQTELTVESVVSTALLELFDTVFVQTVKVRRAEKHFIMLNERDESGHEFER